MADKLVAGVDIGFRHTGISIFQVKDKKMAYISSACFSSKKDKKSKEYVSAQSIAAIQKVLNESVEYLRMSKVEVLVIEIPTGGARSSNALRAMAYATCMAAVLPMLLKIKLITVTPREVKIASTGDPNAEKNAIISAVTKKYPDILKHKKGDQEHICDSVGAIMSAIDRI